MGHSKRIFFQLGTLLALVSASATTQAQQPPLAPKQPESNSRYVTEQPEDSGLAVELHTASSYDDNILGDNAHRIRDFVFEEGGVISLWSSKPSWKLGLEYRPNALFYHTASNFNQVDQRLDFNNESHLSRHLLLRLRDSLDYATGVLEPRSNGDVSLPIGNSSNLNSTILTPFARQFGNDASGETEYDVSRRSSLHFSGGHAFRRFKNVGNANASASLFNTQTEAGGAGYSYRLTRHFTAGLEYQFRNYRFSQLFHDRTQGVFLKTLWDVSPNVTLSFFGGAEYSNSLGQFQVPSTNPLQPGTVTTTLRTMRWNPGGGASVTFRSNQTVLRLTAQQLVADGGGLLPTVTNSYEGAEIRRRMVGRLDIALTASNARSVALQGLTGKGAVDTQSGGLAFEYPLAPVLSVHAGYNYFRQRTNQFVPLALDADRNRFTLGIFYRPHDYRF